MNTSATLITKVKKLTEGEFFIESENGGILLAKAWREDIANQISSALNGKDLDLLNGKAGEILNAQIDELATLRAQNAELREALKDMMSSYEAVMAFAEPHQNVDYIVPKPVKETGWERWEAAHAILYGDDNA